jgi:hypothetical protein
MFGGDLHQHFSSQEKAAGMEALLRLVFCPHICRGVDRGASGAWVKRFGYSQAQALVLSRQQLAAMVELAVALFVVASVISTFQTR